LRAVQLDGSRLKAGFDRGLDAMFRRLSRFWSIVREVNLDAIRRRAETPVRMMVVGDTQSQDALSALLLGDSARRHPMVSLVAPDQVDAALTREPADLALLVSPGSAFADRLASARDLLVSRSIPVVTVLVGSFGYLDTFARRGEHRRIVLPSLNGDQIAPLAARLFDAVAPDTRVALARQFPGLREPLFAQIIDETSRANASYAFSTGLAEIVPLLDVPLNVADIIVLTKNQIVMAYRIALAAGKEGKPRDVVGELVSVVGGSLIFRQIARELIGLIPVVGIIPKVAVAYGGTWAIGRAVATWAVGGQEGTRRSLRHLYRTGLGRGRDVARQLSARSSRAA
jgi:uncharacterized protein (DUF697 family)